MSKSKKGVKVATSNHRVLSGCKNAAHAKKSDKMRSKYRSAFRRGELG